MVSLSEKDKTLDPGKHIFTLISSALDLWPFDPNFNREDHPSMGSPYVWCSVSNRKEWHSRAMKAYFYFDIQCPWPLTPNSIGNIFLPWVVHMCDMGTLSGKGNILELGNRIFILMSSTLDLWPFDPKFVREHLPPKGNSRVIWWL
jgi:hypothetical protein